MPSVSTSATLSPPPGKTTVTTLPAQPPSGRGIWDKLAIAALLVATAAATFTYEQDFDAFWHTASGRWMLQHQRVLDHDPFSTEPEDPSAAWVDVYWLFQVIIAVVQSIAGWPAITVLQCLLATAGMAVFLFSLRKEVPTAWLVLSGLVMLPVLAGRIRMRPEMFTLPFLLVAVVLADRVRRGGPAKLLWWLVPMMLTWVNMHGLYFLGLAAVWGSIIGAALDRAIGRRDLTGNLATKAAVAPAMAASAACLISPWPLEAALHPLRLWSRISGEAYYRFGVSEFLPTYEHLEHQTDMLILVGLTLLVLALNWRKTPLGHVLVLLPVLVLALLAMRNIALLACVCAVPLAVNGGTILRRIAARRPPLAKLAPWASALVLLAGLGLAAGDATEYLYYKRGWMVQTGAGLCPHYYMDDMAKALARLNAPGDVLAMNFGDASAFIYYCAPDFCTPGRKVWMDGRLEIRSLARFRQCYELGQKLATAAGADRAELPRKVRFLAVPWEDQQHLMALSASRRFRLVLVGEAGACFDRLDYDETQPADDIPRLNLDEYDRPMGKDGFVEGAGAIRRTWWRQNPRSRNFQIGGLMLNLGKTDMQRGETAASAVQRRCTLLSIRYLSAALAEGTMREDLTRCYLARAFQQWAWETSESASRGAPVDVSLARANRLYAGTSLEQLTKDNRWAFGLERIRCLFQGGHLDAAAAAADEFSAALPAEERMFTPSEYLAMVNVIAGQIDRVRQTLDAKDLLNMTPLERAKVLTASDCGMTLEAIRQLSAIQDPGAEERLMLGDLLLRLGRTEEARKEYRAAEGPSRELRASPAISLRLALCRWVDGKPYEAMPMLDRKAPGQTEEDVRLRALQDYYKGLLLEELGLYEQAKDTLRMAASGADSDLIRLVERARARLTAVIQ